MPITDAWTPSHTPKPKKVPTGAGLSRSGRDGDAASIWKTATMTHLPLKVKFTAFKLCLIMNHHHCNPSQTFLMKCLFCAKLWAKRVPSLSFPCYRCGKWGLDTFNKAGKGSLPNSRNRDLNCQTSLHLWVHSGRRRRVGGEVERLGDLPPQLRGRGHSQNSLKILHGKNSLKGLEEEFFCSWWTWRVNRL